jgi:dTDP-4-amino-4,6-dideoxygalactose transaminase
MYSEPIPFNKPYLVGNELTHIQEAVRLGKLSGNGHFTQRCQQWFQQTYGFRKCLLTSSCTDALEMAALLLNIGPEDEVILPSYTFVSTANAFVLRGAKLVFADSESGHPNMDVEKLASLISPRTKAIVPVHYGGVACDMDAILKLAEENNLFVVEDAAQGFDAFYQFPNGEKKALGSLGHLACFSFHETKNIISGEGGMLVVNDERFVNRAEIIWEKGTNRSAFFRGESDKYGWVDLGSSFLPSELTAAFLYAQLEESKTIQSKRMKIWDRYHEALWPLLMQGKFTFPKIPPYAEHNAHLFALICNNAKDREDLLLHLKNNQVLAVFHYLSLHSSPYFINNHDGRSLEYSDFFTDTLIRLPLFFELPEAAQNKVVSLIFDFFENR